MNENERYIQYLASWHIHTIMVIMINKSSNEIKGSSKINDY